MPDILWYQFLAYYHRCFMWNRNHLLKLKWVCLFVKRMLILATYTAIWWYRCNNTLLIVNVPINQYNLRNFLTLLSNIFQYVLPLTRTQIACGYSTLASGQSACIHAWITSVFNFITIWVKYSSDESHMECHTVSLHTHK